MPGIDAGRTCRHTTCHLVAPSANAPCRIESGHRANGLARGDYDRRKNHEREDEAARQHHATYADSTDDEGEPENSVHDRRNRREVLDVHLDESVPPARPVRVLLEIDRREDPDRHREDEDDHAEVERCQDRGTGAGLFRKGGRNTVEELPADGRPARDDGVDDQHQQHPERDEHGEEHRGLEQAVLPNTTSAGCLLGSRLVVPLDRGLDDGHS